MKNALLLMLVIMVAVSCKKDSIGRQSEYQTSYLAWVRYKQHVNNSYTYVVSQSSWTGYATETTIRVMNGQIASRVYKAYQLVRNGTNPPVNTLVKGWTEDSTTLNTHGPYEGAALLTLDEVYAKAKLVWLAADSKENDIYFEANNNGLISSCGYVPNGCQDDCFTGISITSIEAL
jgi:hypothetical protein